MRIVKKLRLVSLVTFTSTFVYFCTLMVNRSPGNNQIDEELSIENFHLTDNRVWNSCETIHIAIVCAGNNATKMLSTSLKPLLSHRTSPIHLHLITDEIARHILSVLFETWDVAEFNFSFYSVVNATSQVAFIPNKHYSGVYGLVKLVLAQLVPDHLEKIIALDTDITFTTDIAHLWRMFSSFSDKQVVGLVENQSGWYLKEIVANPWPALGTGFNTGIMAINLKNLRARDWNTLWRSVAEKYLVTHPHVHLADQDIINAVILDNPELVYRLPCQYNVQLSDHTRSESCYSKLRDSKMVIHWNSPKKLKVKNKHKRFFRRTYHTFADLDGYLLRRPQFHCNASRPLIAQDPMDEDDACFEIRRNTNFKYRAHPFYFPYVADEEATFDVTLVSQLSFDRLPIVEPLLYSWQGPISLAVYLYEPQVELFEEFILESSYIRSRKNVGYHLVYQHGSIEYAFNFLRNLALRQVRTPYVFLSHIDFLPMRNSFIVMKQAIQDLMPTGRENRVLVVPAFQHIDNRLKDPKSKDQVLEYLDEGSLSFVDEISLPMNGRSNFSHWKEAQSPYKIEVPPYFEPHIVVRKNVLREKTRFLSYDWNKMSDMIELRAQKYEFILLPNAFTVKQPHGLGTDSTLVDNDEEKDGCLQSAQCELAQELMDLYHYNMKQEFDLKC